MSPLTEQPDALWPLLVYTVAVVGLLVLMLGLSFVLGGRHTGRTMGEPYESGMPVTGSARLRFSAKFYLVAIFFVIFDLETIYLFAWGVAARTVGWTGYAEAMVFLGVLTLTLVYVWRIGALDWAPRVARRGRPPGPAERPSASGRRR